MDRYNRAYRDPKSPLTPLTPLSSHVFNFSEKENIPHDKRANDLKKFTPSCPKRNADHFLHIRNMFEPNPVVHQRSPRLQPQCSPAQLRLEVPCQQKQLQYQQLQQMKMQQMKQQQMKQQQMKQQQMKQQQMKQQQMKQQQMKQQQQEQENVYPIQRGFRRASPVAQRCLSPRTEGLLHRFHVQKYCGLFQREEIDISVLRNLVMEDFHRLGITNAQDQLNILRAAEFAYDFY